MPGKTLGCFLARKLKNCLFSVARKFISAENIKANALYQNNHLLIVNRFIKISLNMCNNLSSLLEKSTTDKTTGLHRQRICIISFPWRSLKKKASMTITLWPRLMSSPQNISIENMLDKRKIKSEINFCLATILHPWILTARRFCKKSLVDTYSR